jgi:hypothetical protein
LDTSKTLVKLEEDKSNDPREESKEREPLIFESASKPRGRRTKKSDKQTPAKEYDTPARNHSEEDEEDDQLLMLEDEDDYPSRVKHSSGKSGS